MKFKVGDKVRKVGDSKKTIYYIRDTRCGSYGMNQYLLDDWFFEDEIEPIEDSLVKKIEERNNKPVKMISDENLLNDNDPIKPAHYRKGEIDLYEAWYRTYPFNEFRAIMSAIAERYMKRDKNDRVEDLEKGIYTLERLKEYEVQHGND